MTKRVMLMVVCSLGLTVAVMAASDPFCEQLGKVLAASSGGFATLKGEAKKDETAMWQATQSLPGLSDCAVVGDADRSYVCTVYAGDDDEAARIAYADHVDRLGKCLGDAWAGRETANAEVTEHLFARADGSGGSVRLRSQSGGAEAHTVQLWVGSVHE